MAPSGAGILVRFGLRDTFSLAIVHTFSPQLVVTSHTKKQ